MEGRIRPDNLFARGEGSVKYVFYLADAAAALVSAVAPDALRAVSCGSKFLSYKPLDDPDAVRVFPCFESIALFRGLATKRVVALPPADVARLLAVDGVPTAELSDAARAALAELSHGSLVVTVDGTEIAYGTMKGAARATLLIKKEHIREERFKLGQLFADLLARGEAEPSAEESEGSN
jgi:hypothetical protein